MRFFLATVIVFAFIFSGYSQNSVYKRYSTKDGLPSNEVYYIMQDSKGYIWFATDNGVSCYNGYEFRNFGLLEGLPSNTVLSLYEDYKGRIWCVCRNSSLAYIDNWKLEPYKHNDVLDRHIEHRNRIFNNSIYIDTNETLYLGTYNHGFFEIDKDGNVKNDLGKSFFNIREVAQMYLYSCSLTKRGKEGITYTNENVSFEKEFSYFTGNGRIYSFRIDQNRLLFSNGGKTAVLNRDTVCVYDTDNVAWIGQSNGHVWISQYNEGVKCYINSNLQSQPRIYHQGETITGVLSLKSGVVWISTLDGVYKYNNFLVNNIGEKKLPNDKIVEIERGKDKDLWFATDKGYVVKKSGNLMNIYSELKTRSVLSLLFSEQLNELYISAAVPHSFFYINDDGEMHEKEIDPTHTRTSSFFRDMVVWGDTTIFFSGLVVGKFKFENGFVGFDNLSLIENRGLSIASYSKDSSLLIGTKKGVIRHCFKEGLTSAFKENQIKGSIVDIEIDEENNVWFASKERGVFFLCKDSVYQISTEDGLSSNTVNTIWIEDSVVWAGTMNGLNKIIIQDLEKKDIQIQNIYEWHGIASNIIYDIASVDDSIYVATDEGLSFFNKVDLVPKDRASNVYLSKISIDEEERLLKDNFELPYNENNVAIEFVALNYRIESKTKYKYRLGGADQNWVETRSRVVRYSSLQPGVYKFEVVAQDEYGIWGTTPASVTITINKPYWQTWWFLLLMFLLVAFFAASIVFLIYRVKIKESKKRSLLQNNLNKLKQEALAQQMNPHFIFNTLSSIQYYINENDKEASNKYLTMFSKLMRLTLAGSHKKFVSIEEELNALEIYMQLEQLRFEEKFVYSIDVDSSVKVKKLLIPSLMLQPFIENAIWHGIMHKKSNDGYIKLQLEQKANQLEFIISDNGVGRQKSKEINANKRKTHKSFGTKIIESRLSLIGTLYNNTFSMSYIDMKDSKGLASGTQVIITLPMRYL